MTGERFKLPEEVELPAGAAGWEELYAYFSFFSKKKEDEKKFWFQDNLHFPFPLTPFEADILTQYHPAPIGAYTSKVWAVPAALGPFYRVFRGYIYISSETITDSDKIAKNAETFKRRAGYYFQNWEEVLGKWREKTKGFIEELRGLEFAPLPDTEPDATVFGTRGLTVGFDLIEKYDRLMLLWEKSWYYHFEMFLAYSSALLFMDLARTLFPGISDKTVFGMITGIKSPLWEPDEKLKELARSAIEHGVESDILSRLPPEELVRRLQKSEGGKAWLEEFEKDKYPYFYVGSSQMPGFYNPARMPSWIHDLSIPLGFIAGYVERLRRGENLERPLEGIIKERERITQEYMALLKNEDDRKSFSDALDLAKLAWPYTEEHNWWYDNLIFTILWTKASDVGKVLASHGVIEEPADIFYMKVEEVRVALHDLVLAWGEDKPPKGLEYWPEIIGRRKGILMALEGWKPPRALGEPPKVITEPFTIMLWGITPQRVGDWLQGIQGGAQVDEIRGLAGSPGVVEGPARIIRRVEQISMLKEGDIIVSPVTSPMWSPAFGIAKGVVTDIGGMMSHTAIVCREYGIPAVTGTGMATDAIKDGDILRVDGNQGLVKILKRSG